MCTLHGTACTEIACSDVTTTPPPSAVGKRQMTTGHVEQHGGCHYNGVQYWAGDSFRSTDGCNTCYCSAHGGAMCTEMFCQNMLLCHYNGTDHKPGSSYPSTDGCNTCTCSESGFTSCTEKACMRGCTYNGHTHMMGEKFNSVDGCNTCHCQEDGTYTCTTEACMPKVCDYNGKMFQPG